MSRKVKIGVCGFPGNRKKIFENLEVIEVQQTFYEPPSLNTLKKWRQEAPENFEFTVKAWQLITHDAGSPTYRRLKRNVIGGKENEAGGFKWTSLVQEAYEECLKCCEILKAKFLLFQTPSSFKPTEENIRSAVYFFKKVDRKNLKFVWEPRGNWDEEVLKRIAKECEIIIGGDPLKGAFIYGSPLYIRLHGIKGFRYKYTEEDFKRLMEVIRNKNAYVLFNNIYMLEDAISFKRSIQ